MPVVLVANPKGGVGKSTLATQVAGYFASRGRAVMLGDVDRQQSSRLWLSLRPPAAAPIATWEATDNEGVVRPPKGTTHAVLDSPAGLHGKRLRQVLALADRVIVPLQPSIFDIYATRDFLDQLNAERNAAKTRVGLIAMRVDGRTLAAERLREFTAGLGLPVVGELRDTQNYVQLAARGLSVFDVAPGRVQRDLEQWQPICDWLEH
ncbi:ParA family protein [Variovorax dokdonensis]|uniref:ParA family protein n=1 Tax=Variovorax dokdonensis TaxID=344883 RepID=A0ABT7N5D9_9BURK|nr:ParA family protein [Variovorax dokdonensis]MDM0043169.1 ParA family protein [Variovorax dokdonensis]